MGPLPCFLYAIMLITGLFLQALTEGAQAYSGPEDEMSCVPEEDGEE